MDYDKRTLTAFFDTMAEAESAAARVEAAGIQRSDIRIVEGSEQGTAEVNNESFGFWDSLADFFFPDDDRAAYAEGLRRGGYMLSAVVSTHQSAEVSDILDDEGVVDFDERVENWRSEGWDQETAVLGHQTFAPGMDLDRNADAANLDARRDMRDGAMNAEGKIDVMEERLRVGKREAQSGRVHVRSYVVEEPITQDVTLRDERVTITRNPVDRPADGVNAFRDATISAEEHVEEAVVSKEARVVEEISLETEVRSRTETISDTVRKTKVEIDDERAEQIASGRSTDTTPRGI